MIVEKYTHRSESGALSTLSMNPLLADFYGDLRQHAIEIHNQENGSSSKHTETDSIMNQDMGKKPD